MLNTNIRYELSRTVFGLTLDDHQFITLDKGVQESGYFAFLKKSDDLFYGIDGTINYNEKDDSWNAFLFSNLSGEKSPEYADMLYLSSPCRDAVAVAVFLMSKDVKTINRLL